MNDDKGMTTREAAQAIELDAKTEARAVESLVLRGDLSGLGPADRARYYIAVCKSVGLAPASKPFDFLRLNGKEVLYANKGCADSLAAIHRVNRKVIDGPKVIDLAGTKLVYCLVEATLPNGRVETATATVPLVDPVNVMMKCETKGKRRVTLAILGLGALDEMELETIPANVKEHGGGVDLSRANDTPPEGSPAARPVLPPGIEADNARRADRNAAARVDVETLRAASPEVADDPERDAIAQETAPTPAEMPVELARYYDAMSAMELPGEGTALWVRSRTYLATLPAPDREAAWKALCERVGVIGRMKGAKVWLKKQIADHDARETTGATDHQAA